LEWCKF